MEKPEIRPTGIQKRLNGWLPKLVGVTKCRISIPLQNCISIRLGDFAPHICEVAYQMFTRLVVLGSSNSVTPRPLRQFWRSIRQKTSFRARMCLLGVPRTNFYILTPFSPKNANFWSIFDGTNFGSKRALTWGIVSKHSLNDQLRFCKLDDE